MASATSAAPLVLASSQPRDTDDSNRLPPRKGREGKTFFENVVVVDRNDGTVRWNRSSDCFSRFTQCANILLSCHPKSDFVRGPLQCCEDIVDVIRELLLDQESRCVSREENEQEPGNDEECCPLPRSFPSQHLPRPFEECKHRAGDEIGDGVDREVRFRIINPVDIRPYFPLDVIENLISGSNNAPILEKRMVFFLRSDRTGTHAENHFLPDRDRSILVAGNTIRRSLPSKTKTKKKPNLNHSFFLYLAFRTSQYIT